MKNLIQQQVLDGYFSLTGYYYSSHYLISKINKELATEGHLKRVNYSHFPRTLFTKALGKIQKGAIFFGNLL
ncbi:MAG: hypothetical protein EU543_03805 [Promethearchaeota archaeon]|nr:MAG: hypothetical protein EU543_03805 [Candidatus Lokiarchaeota archaeon]